MARKRKRVQNAPFTPKKHIKLNDELHRTPSPVLALCYSKVLTLREYFLSSLPTDSRVRRRRLETCSDAAQSRLLDTCLVGILIEPSPELQQERAQELISFTQTQGTASGCHTARGQSCSIEEVVDFAVWLLFKKCPPVLTRPKHLLCNGLRKWAIPKAQENDSVKTFRLPGIFQQHPNGNLDRLKASPWDLYLSLLGPDGEAIVSSLLLDCGLFVRLSHGNHNYLQISGIPISDLNGASGAEKQILAPNSHGHAVLRKPSDISFVRNRILYAKPSLNKSGIVQFGLKHVHILQRYSQLDKHATVHVMKHIFPRQFGYHNVFTSPIDPRESAQRFPDYTYREGEFHSGAKQSDNWIPRRLRGACERLVHKLRKQHARCSYTQLLRHYCRTMSMETMTTERADECHDPKSSSSTGLVTQPPVSARSSCLAHAVQPTSQSDFSFLSHSTSASQVSAFCRSVLFRLVPRNAFGTGDDGDHNWSIILTSIDAFVQRRRFETLCLHEIVNNIGIRCVTWLQPPKLQQHAKMSRSDLEKRLEIFHELIYYLFDSLLVPLIRSNFYVTESGLHRNKLFYFRHDVWRKLSEPSLAMLRLKIYQPLKPREVRNTFDSRTLGYSNVRLLPKAEGTRPITNLKRRMLSVNGNRRTLGPSINAQLGPIFSALGYERQQHPARLGGSIFSIGGLHQKLKNFKQMVLGAEKVYFVKVDIRSCFDTIPQRGLLDTVDKIINHAQYRVTRYTELKPSEYAATYGSGKRCRQRFANFARPTEDGAVLSESVAAEIVQGRDGRILMDSGNEKVWQHGQLMKLLKEHVQNNIVKIGKKHFKQTNGIPQGSVLSSILCSFFYSDFEMQHLGFLQLSQSMLVRLIDDFMLITTDKIQALRFLHVMIEGNQEYGISVNPDKTLANFEAQVGHQKIPRHHGRDGFPFCGMAIDTSTLEVRKDWQRKDKFVNNGLTVDVGSRPTATFRRKVLLSFKMQLHAMLLDTTLNSPTQIAATYLEAFGETAMKMHQYAKNMPPNTRPSAASIRELIQELVKVALKLGQKRQMGASAEEARTPVSRMRMAWMAAIAFERVLLPKQNRYPEILAWLRAVRGRCEASIGTTRSDLKKLLEVSDRAEDGCVY